MCKFTVISSRRRGGKSGMVSYQYVTRSSNQTSGHQGRSDVIFILQIREQVLELSLTWLRIDLPTPNPVSLQANY